MELERLSDPEMTLGRTKTGQDGKDWGLGMIGGYMGSRMTGIQDVRGSEA